MHMTFKRMMVLGAMASALAFTGCRDRSQSEQDVMDEGARDQSQQVPATGGSGRTDTIPGSTDTLGGVEQDSEGVDLGGTGAEGGAVDDTGSTGGSGTLNDQGSGTLDDDGTGGSGLEDDNRGTGGSDEGMR
jgi:hypothetical protein